MIGTPRGRGRGRATATLDLIDVLVAIAEEIHPCNVRALAYQLFNRKLIPSMGKNNTARVSRLCVIARESGRMPWDWIVDPTRQEQQVATWEDPVAFGKAVQRSYRRNKWDAQPVHVSVWSEKSTIEGTLRPVLEEYEVPFQVLHGWSGATPVWDAAQANLNRSQDTLILYVGDYDPSGMGMSDQDLPQRLARYSTNTPEEKDLSPGLVRGILDQARIKIQRVALTDHDGAALGAAIGFPAADKGPDAKGEGGDSRYPWFVENYGQWCWELDALSPSILRLRVENAIVETLDMEVWDRYVQVEKAEREAITLTCASWSSILQQDQK